MGLILWPELTWLVLMFLFTQWAGHSPTSPLRWRTATNLDPIMTPLPPSCIMYGEGWWLQHLHPLPAVLLLPWKDAVMGLQFLSIPPFLQDSYKVKLQKRALPFLHAGQGRRNSLNLCIPKGRGDRTILSPLPSQVGIDTLLLISVL